ncbi:MAG: hypothetical protein GIKADHBN_00676 [Phycisphaerales bacterium]|nr:hypothetical protein [Phycisphaerales bacterium]MCK6477693.1 hypothetical protein [Phycisphaerales bacterium]
MSYRRTLPLALLALAGLNPLVTVALAQSGPPSIDQPNILREGTGSRRDSLTTRELAPFDATAWSKVTRWSADRAPAAADLSGQVVLICTWKYYHPVSRRAMETARRLAETYAGKGLVVAAIHDNQNWDEAVKAAPALASADARFFVGLDEKGEFRRALDSDGDPDFYVLDRAGQLRFADIATASVEPAITMLLAETAEKASARKADIQSELDRLRREAAKSQGARESVDMSSIPPIPPGFTAPTPDDFMRIHWPPTRFQRMDSNTSSDPNADKGPPPSIQLPDGEGWIGPKPELQGRVWVLYFWAFDSYESYSIMQRMDQLQKAKGRDVAVVGILTKFADPNASSTDQTPEDPARLLKKVTDFTRGKALQHSTFVDPTGVLLSTTRGADTSSDRVPLPYVVVCSSDGTVRFSGWAKHPSFESSLDNTLSLDPGVRARRTADAAYLKARTK